MDRKTFVNRPSKGILKDSWVWKMAWRDARNNFGRLFLFISSIIIGIAALVAINSFHINLQADIDEQAKELLGADLVAEANNPFEPELLTLFDSLQLPMSEEVNFASMVYFQHSGETRLIRVVALKGGFPYYGDVETSPAGVYHHIFSGPFILLDESLSSQYNVSTEDTIRIGKMDFFMRGEVTKIPGGSGFASTFTPSVYISTDYLDSTGLIQFGSRVNYKRYFKTATTEESDAVWDVLRPELRKFGHGLDDVEERKEDLGEGLANLYKFFNLLAFIALILGCIGIASSVHIYAREKRASVAVLRCIGASGWQSFNIYFIQTIITGLLGSIVGIFLGIGIQFGLPLVLGEFLPVELNLSISWFAIFEGLLLGLVISILFSILPLVSVRFVAPLSVLRIDYKGPQRLSKTALTVGILTLLFPLSFATYQSESFETGAFFFLGLAAAFLLLLGLAQLLMFTIKKYFPDRLSFVWRQSLSNLFRPNNQTSVLVVVIGLGAFLVATLYITQTSLLNQVEFIGQENQSNTILFDIQPTQKDGVAELTETNGLEVKQMVPIVTSRIAELNGKTVTEIRKDTTDNIENWALTREYRVTYRDSLHISETLLEGEVHQVKDDKVFVTISQGMKENLEVEVGDTVVWDVQGVSITTYIGGVREVDWPQDPPNFLFVFPNGVLEEAPQIYVMTTYIGAKNIADKYSRELVTLFPNVSLIDLRLIIKTINEFFGKVSFIIQFMALFSIITGLIVLAGAVINSKFARMKENVMLRTIGAVQKQIIGLTLIEYGYLGLFAGLTGILLAMLSGWALSLFLFEIIFFPNIAGLLTIWLGVVFLTMFIGWYNTRSILNRSPMEVLRSSN